VAIPGLTRPRVKIAVIVPAGPRDDVLDTLASVVHYTESPRIIVVVDDKSMLTSSNGFDELPSDIAVIPAPPGALGGQGGLWVKLAAGYKWVLQRYEPQIVLRLDADALIIGHGLEDAAGQAFASAPEVGLLGSYRVGPDGTSRDTSWAARNLRAEAGFRGLLHPRVRSSLRRNLRHARSFGYVDGENVLGGAYIHSYLAASRIFVNGLLNQPWLAQSKLGEDHIMTLLTMAVGYQIGDFSGPTDPMAIKWRGLPAHPGELLSCRKLVVHSVRSWENLDERQIRAIFAQARVQDQGRPTRPSPV
jgi:glycosyltransferase involved in cell wall biosynthesis